MDYLWSFAFIASSMIFIIIICFHFFVSSNLLITLTKNKKKFPLPPGKIGLPFIGESMEYLASIREGKVDEFVFDRVTRYSSQVFKTGILGETTVVMHGTEENKLLFMNEGNLVVDWWPKHVIKIIPSISSHRFKMRDLLQPFVKHNILQKYLSVMDEMTHQYLESHWRGKHMVVAYPSIKFCTLALACKLFLSVEKVDLITKFASQLNTLSLGFVSIPINLPWTSFGQATRATNKLMNQLKVIIRERKQAAAEKSKDHDHEDDETGDFLSHMIRSTDDDDKMNEDDLASRALEMLIAGHETTTSVILVILSYLSDHPDIYDAVYKEQIEVTANKTTGELLNLEDIRKMKYTWNVVREAMRIYPAALFIFREAVTDITYAGYHIPKGWKILVNTQSMHMDPHYFPEPDKFNPQRFEGDGPTPFSYIPFGGGSMLCPGRSYAQFLIMAFIHNLVKKFSWKKLDPTEKFIYNPAAQPVGGLPIYLYPHH